MTTPSAGRPPLPVTAASSRPAGAMALAQSRSGTILIAALPLRDPAMNRYLLAFTIFAAFVNPVPSRAEFHPIRWHGDPYNDDIMGSGLEVRERAPLRRAAACEEPMERKVARQWRDLAERVRRLAALSEGEQRDRLLAKAEEFEERARLWEEKRGAPRQDG
jgi:hypothetical protein